MSAKKFISLSFVGLLLVMFTFRFSAKFLNGNQVSRTVEPDYKTNELAAVAEEKIKTFDISSDDKYRNYMTVIDNYSKNHQIKNSDFCIVGYKYGVDKDNSRGAFVIWFQGHHIIQWEQGNFGGNDLDSSRRDLNWDRDIVEDSDPRLVMGSTYLETRDWLRAIMDDCSKYGIKVHVK